MPSNSWRIRLPITKGRLTFLDFLARGRRSNDRQRDYRGGEHEGFLCKADHIELPS
jgi:hypothetical protein